MNKKRLKELYIRLKIKLRIDGETRDFFSNYLNNGEIIKLISYNENKFDTCSSNMPSEYFSNQNIISEAEILTENNETYIIREEYWGLNFESPCDKYILKIIDINNNIIANTEDYYEYKKNKKKEKQDKKNKKLSKKI